MMESTLWRISKVRWMLMAVHVIRSLVKDGIYIAYLDGGTSYRRPYNVCGLEHYLLFRTCFIKRVNKHFKIWVKILMVIVIIYKKKQETLIYYMNMTGYKSYSIYDDAIINNNNFTLMEMIYRKPAL